MLTNTQKALLDKDTQALLDSGFLTEDLKISDDLTYFLRHLVFLANKDAVVKRAKEIVIENEKKAKGC